MTPSGPMVVLAFRSGWVGKSSEISSPAPRVYSSSIGGWKVSSTLSSLMVKVGLGDCAGTAVDAPAWAGGGAASVDCGAGCCAAQLATVQKPIASAAQP